MGIGYVDSVVVYNRYINGLMISIHTPTKGVTQIYIN